MSVNQPVPTVEVKSISTSSLVLDSTFRNSANEFPGSYEAHLSGAIRGARRVYHRTVLWSSSLYGHNKESMRIAFQTMAGGNTIFYCFVTPYYVFTSPDGTDETVPYAVPVDGSYAADLEAALNDPFTLVGNTYTAVVSATFSVRYAQGQFRITADDQFAFVQSCDWLQNAHFTHGFGTKAPSTSVYAWESPNSGSLANVCYSSETANLSPQRYLGVTCNELVRARALPSFSNVRSTAFSVDEMNVFPVTYDQYGVFHEQTTVADPTVINMDSKASSVQTASPIIYTSNGKVLKGQDVLPMVFILANWTVADITALASRTGRTLTIRNTLVQIYDNNASVVIGAPQPAYPVFPIQSDVICKSDEIVHLFTLEQPSNP